MDRKIRNRPTIFMVVEDPSLPFSNSKFGHKREVRICSAIQPKYCSTIYLYLEF